MTVGYGGDYNPEQWPREVWDQDYAAFELAGINTLTLGVFAWAHLQPAEDGQRQVEEHRVGPRPDDGAQRGRPVGGLADACAELLPEHGPEQAARFRVVLDDKDERRPARAVGAAGTGGHGSGSTPAAGLSSARWCSEPTRQDVAVTSAVGGTRAGVEAAVRTRPSGRL